MKKDFKGKDQHGQDICPHCGAPLLTRTDYRNHLTLKTCQNMPSGGVVPPWYDPPKGRRDPDIESSFSDKDCGPEDLPEGLPELGRRTREETD